MTEEPEKPEVEATPDPGGRPLKFKSVEELERKIDDYFKSCWDHQRDMFGNRLVDKTHPDHSKEKPVYLMKQVKPYTVSGLAVFLDTTRETLMDYESGKYDDPEKTKDENKKFSDTLKKAKHAIYAYVEEQLFSPGRATGSIFSLKNNYGWKDKTEVDSRENLTVEIVNYAEEKKDEKPEGVAG